MIGDRTAGLGWETLEICRLLYSITLGARTKHAVSLFESRGDIPGICASV